MKVHTLNSLSFFITKTAKPWNQYRQAHAPCHLQGCIEGELACPTVMSSGQGKNSFARPGLPKLGIAYDHGEVFRSHG